MDAQWKMVRAGFCLTVMVGLLAAGLWGRWRLCDRDQALDLTFTQQSFAAVEPEARTRIMQSPRVTLWNGQTKWVLPSPWDPPEVPLSPGGIDPIARLAPAYERAEIPHFSFFLGLAR